MISLKKKEEYQSNNYKEIWANFAYHYKKNGNKLEIPHGIPESKRPRESNDNSKFASTLSSNPQFRNGNVGQPNHSTSPQLNPSHSQQSTHSHSQQSLPYNPALYVEGVGDNDAEQTDNIDSLCYDLGNLSI